MKHLYLRPVEYNMARILNEVRNMVVESGGKIVKDYNEPRSITETIFPTDGVWGERSDGKEGETVEVNCVTYISFVLDGYYYYVQVDENPFFDFLLKKAKVVDDEVSLNTYLDKYDKSWLTDNLWDFGEPYQAIQESATTLFEILKHSKECGKRLEYRIESVPNRYNDGYHRERVMCPERKNKLEYV